MSSGLMHNTEVSVCICVCCRRYLHAQWLQSCLTLCNPMDCNPSGSSVDGILQARILEWVAMLCSKGSSHPEIESVSPALQADSLPTELPGKFCWGRYLHLQRLWGNSPGSPLHFLLAQTVKNLPAMQETWV